MSRTPPRRAHSTAAGAAETGGTPFAPLSRDSQLAAEIKGLAAAGDRDAARERYGELVAHQQRRAVRIAYQYLRDAQDADEAVQDAFIKVFTHITSYREDLPFEVWFTRILVNACLDLRKSRSRRLRWTVPMSSTPDAPPTDPATPEPTPEQRLVSRERASEITAAVDSLPDRQRTVFTLCHLAEQTTAEVSQALGLSEATVRVHLFRAVRKLRKMLDRENR
jgi:RNA polymerase sigma-70 factor (ECF subfamily)